MTTEKFIHQALFTTLIRLSQFRRESINPMHLRASLLKLADNNNLKEIIRDISYEQGWPAPKCSNYPDSGRLPCIVLSSENRIGIISARDTQGAWSVLWFQSAINSFIEEKIEKFEIGDQFIRLRMTTPFVASSSPSFQLVWLEIWKHKRLLFDISAGTIAISILALVTSFYSMQVYDRVVPTQAIGTLLALTLGVIASIILETTGKWIRAQHIHYLTDAIDQNLARSVYSRFLGIRLDQLPPSIGSTSSRLRSYELIRGFLLNLSTQLLVDLPLALLFLVILSMIGGALAIIPAVFLLFGIAIGYFFHNRTEQLAKLATPAQHQKLGLLVESIEGAEIIKSGQGDWRMLSKWLDLTDESRQHEQGMRKLSEIQQFLVAMFQQGSYVLMVAIGALQIGGQSGFTMGALIACSILSGRILAPIATIPSIIMQWAQTRVAINDLDKLWTLAQDHPPGSEPLILNEIRGKYQLENVGMQYHGSVALKIKDLQINEGERVAIIGGVGSGKTSLLRILSGMYKPENGRILLDGLDIENISKSSLTTKLGYVPQDGRLFAGTLRENLVIGLSDPGDDALLDAARKTGLFEAVIIPHPKGFSREIYEGGSGLSGGQRQLVHITRALLRNPTIWLMDEPTASMDATLESKVINMLHSELDMKSKSTLIIVTHKPQLLSLVSRVIILLNQNIIMDGPRDLVLNNLNNLQKPVFPSAQKTSP